MRPIDADAITYCAYDLDAYHFFRAVDEEDIAEMPTLTLDDLRPKGRWKPLPEDYREQILGNKCSLCGYEYFGSRFNFCPSCGADMRGGGEEGDRGDL